MGVRRDMSRSHRRIRQIKKTGRAFNPAGWYSTLEASRLEDQLQAVLEFTIVVVNDSRCFHVVSGQSGRDQVVRRTAWLVQARCVCRTTVHCADRISRVRSEEHTSELQSHVNLVCRLLLEKKKTDTALGGWAQ